MQDSIFIAAPPGTSWPLSIEIIERRLQEQFPGVRCFRKHAPVSDKDYLDFEMTLDDEVRHGSYFNYSYLILSDGAPAFWAETIVWFLRLLPTGTAGRDGRGEP